jgi:cardiolipin synthase (CMP-forming)
VSVLSRFITDLNLPNLLSIIRLTLVPFFIVALSRGDFVTALILFAAAGVTDGLDGLIARWWKLQTPMGAFLDPMADKILMTASFITLSLHLPNQTCRLPLWLAIMLISRDILIVIIAYSLNMVHGVERFPPSLWGKWNTIFQVATIVLVLWANLSSGVAPALPFAYGGALSFTALSGFHYLYRTGKWLKQESSPDH